MRENERKCRSVLGGADPDAAESRRTNEIIYSARTRSATPGGAQKTTDTRKQLSEEMLSHCEPRKYSRRGKWSLPVTSTRRVGQK